jgi:hypothetical protein
MQHTRKPDELLSAIHDAELDVFYNDVILAWARCARRTNSVDSALVFQKCVEASLLATALSLKFALPCFFDRLGSILALLGVNIGVDELTMAVSLRNPS